LKLRYFCGLNLYIIIISSLPMRNWNPEILQENLKKFKDFQPTYEELKL